jgi:hypothetical protein
VISAIEAQQAVSETQDQRIADLIAATEAQRVKHDEEWQHHELSLQQMREVMNETSRVVADLIREWQAYIKQRPKQ